MSKKNGLKQIAITSLLLGANCLVFADVDSSAISEIAINDNFLPAEIASRDSSKDSKKQKSYKDKKNQTQSPALGDKNPPYTNPNRFIFKVHLSIGERTWMRSIAFAEGNVAFDNTLTAVPEVRTTTNNLKIKDLNYKWDPGFKAGIGVIFGEMDEWDIFLNWTWLQSKANRSQGSDTPFTTIDSFTDGHSSADFINSPFSVNVLRSPMVQSKTNWKLHYNTS